MQAGASGSFKAAYSKRVDDHLDRRRRQVVDVRQPLRLNSQLSIGLARSSGEAAVLVAEAGPCARMIGVHAGDAASRHAPLRGSCPSAIAAVDLRPGSRSVRCCATRLPGLSLDAPDISSMPNTTAPAEVLTDGPRDRPADRQRVCPRLGVDPRRVVPRCEMDARRSAPTWHCAWPNARRLAHPGCTCRLRMTSGGHPGAVGRASGR